MKRLFSIICLLLVVSFLFAGCLQKKEEGGAGAGEKVKELQFPGMEKGEELTKEQKNVVEAAFLKLVFPDSEKNQKKYLGRCGANAYFLYENGDYAVLSLKGAYAVNGLFSQKFELHGKQYRIIKSGFEEYEEFSSLSYHGLLFVYQNGALIPFPEACERGIVSEEGLQTFIEATNTSYGGNAYIYSVTTPKSK